MFWDENFIFTLNNQPKMENVYKTLLPPVFQNTTYIRDVYLYNKQQPYFVWCLVRQRKGGLNSGLKSATIVTDAFA